MRRLGRAAGIYLGIIFVVILGGFLAQRIFGGDDATTEAREAVESLPYRVVTHPAPDGVLLGTARGGHGVAIHFAISADGPQPHGIPSRLVRIADGNVLDSGGFWVWDDSELWARRGSEAQLTEATKVSVAIEEALCRKETGDPCEI